MQLLALTASLALAGVGLALPTGDTTLPSPVALEKRGVLQTRIEAIMPKSTSCDGRGDECTTAADAAPFLHESFVKYDIGMGAERAGLLSLIAYESAELQYRKNLDQSAQTGRGTANEQSGAFNVEYAASLGLGTYTAETVMDLSSNNIFNFYSAAWYYSTQAVCEPTRTLAKASPVDVDAWFDSYLTVCVGLGAGWETSQPEREAYWVSAKEAFGI